MRVELKLTMMMMMIIWDDEFVLDQIDNMTFPTVHSESLSLSTAMERIRMVMILMMILTILMMILMMRVYANNLRWWVCKSDQIDNRIFLMMPFEPLVWHIISIHPQCAVHISTFWLEWGWWWTWISWWWVSSWSFRWCLLTLVWQIIRIHPLADCDDDMDDQNYHKIISGCWAGLD